MLTMLLLRAVAIIFSSGVVHVDKWTGAFTNVKKATARAEMVSQTGKVPDHSDYADRVDPRVFALRGFGGKLSTQLSGRHRSPIGDAVYVTCTSPMISLSWLAKCWTERKMKRARKKLRGIYESPTGSGVFYIQYFDIRSRRHHEKAGRRSDAIALLAKRKIEKLQRKKLPESFHQSTVTFGELLDDALAVNQVENGQETAYNHERKFDFFRERFGNRQADTIKKQEILEFLADLSDERGWSPTTYNRWQVFFSFVFRVGIDNEKILATLHLK